MILSDICLNDIEFSDIELSDNNWVSDVQWEAPEKGRGGKMQAKNKNSPME